MPQQIQITESLSRLIYVLVFTIILAEQINCHKSLQKKIIVTIPKKIINCHNMKPIFFYHISWFIQARKWGLYISIRLDAIKVRWMKLCYLKLENWCGGIRSNPIFNQQLTKNFLKMQVVNFFIHYDQL